MNRIDKVRNMTTDELAKLIIERDITDDFCKGACGEENDCLHDVECCVRWLEEEIGS